MRILIISAYENEKHLVNGKKGNDGAVLFRKSIKTAIRCFVSTVPNFSLDFGDDDENNYIMRSIDQLSDMIFDWDNECLDDGARLKLRNFDKIDLIFIGGDLKMLPWEPKAMQAVTLIHMALTAKKPVLALGFGALLSIYSISTQGGKFHVLNGPTGNRNPSRQLPHFDRFATETGAYPSGWLDHSTGDMYCYKPGLNVWQPVCNIGIHRYPLKSPTYDPQISAGVYKLLKPTGFADLKPSFANPQSNIVVTSQTINAHKKKESYSSASLDEKVLCIRKTMLQHPFLHGMEEQMSLQQHSYAASPLTLLLRTYPHWFINADSALPVNEGIQVLADCKEGSVILSKDNSLLLAIELEKSHTCYPAAYHLIKTFVQHTLANMLPKHTPQPPFTTDNAHSNNNAINNNSTAIKPLSLYSLLFGTDGLERDSTYDTSKDRRPRSAPLSRTAVRSALPDGPTQVDPPNIQLFFRAVNNVLFDPYALTAQRKHTSLGKKPRVTVQNPLSVRHVRLQRLFEATGFIGSGSFVDNSLASSELSSSGSVHQDMPSESRDLFAGRIQNTNSIAKRRSQLVGDDDKVVVRVGESRVVQQGTGYEEKGHTFSISNNNYSNDSEKEVESSDEDHPHHHNATRVKTLATVEEEDDEERIYDTWSSTEEIRSITPFTESVEAGSILYESLELSSTAPGPVVTSALADFPFPIMPTNAIVDHSNNNLKGGRKMNSSFRLSMAESADKIGPVVIVPVPPTTPRSTSTATSTATSTSSINNNYTNNNPFPSQLQPDSRCINTTAVRILPPHSKSAGTFISRILTFKTTQHFLPLHHPTTATKATPPPDSKGSHTKTAINHGRASKTENLSVRSGAPTAGFHPIAL